MSKKAKVLISMLLVLILTLAVPTAMVMAQEEEGDATASRAGQLFARVAEILGFDQAELENAFEQARAEMREEAPDWYTENVTASCIEERLVNRQQVRQMLREEMANGCTGNVSPQEMLECIQEQLQNRQQIREQLQDEILDRPAPRARLFKAMRGRHVIAVPDEWSGGV